VVDVDAVGLNAKIGEALALGGEVLLVEDGVVDADAKGCTKYRRCCAGP